LNATYVALVEGLDADARTQVDAILDPPPPVSRAQRKAALAAQSAAFATQHGGEFA